MHRAKARALQSCAHSLLLMYSFCVCDAFEDASLTYITRASFASGFSLVMV